MRPTGIIALYYCFFASLASIVISIFGSIMVPRTGLGYFFLSVFLFFPLIPVHTALVYFFRQIGYSKENIMWAMSALLWLALFVFMTQLYADHCDEVIPFIVATGLSQSFGYMRTCALRPPKPKTNPKPAGMYSTI